MKKLLTLTLMLISFASFSQVKISQIIAYDYNNQKNSFSTNIVGKDTNEFGGSGSNCMVVVKLEVIPGQEYKYVGRKLKITAQYESGEVVEQVYETQEIKIPLVDGSFHAPFIIQKGPIELTIKAELFEEGKLVSTKKQLLLAGSGD